MKCLIFPFHWLTIVVVNLPGALTESCGHAPLYFQIFMQSKVINFKIQMLKIPEGLCIYYMQMKYWCNSIYVNNKFFSVNLICQFVHQHRFNIII